MKTIDFNAYAVLGNNGSIDENATVTKFTGELRQYSASADVQTEAIASAVSEVFDEHLGKPIKMPVLASLATHKLGTDTPDIDNMGKLVQAYVRVNAKPGGLFTIKKGPGCGVTRNADRQTAAE